MSRISRKLRLKVHARAGGRCEYCHIPTVGQVAPFPIDHIIPESAGGRTILANLALACPRCNGHKWAHQKAADPITRKRVPLFNPRKQVWSEHFAWSPANPVLLEAKTPCGRATVRRLQLNHPEMLEVRRQLLALGVQLSDDE